MPLPKETSYTMDDIYRLPDGKRAELIGGRIYMMAPPNRIHQKLTFALARKLADYIETKHGSCEVYPAPFAVFLNADNSTYVEPDISVICDKNKLTDSGCNGAPDFIIEVVSPGSRRMDYVVKNALYSDAGVIEYWIVDPQTERTMIYHYGEDVTPMIIPFSQPVQSGIYDDLQITIAELLK